MSWFHRDVFGQMDVPKSEIAVYRWSLVGDTGRASGEIRVVGADAANTGGSASTEYWYVHDRAFDSSGKDTGRAKSFTIQLAELGPPRAGFIDAGAVLKQLVDPESRPLAAVDIPPWVVWCTTPLIADGGPAGVAALHFVVSADEQNQAAPIWYWSPGKLPNLFGKDKSHELVKSKRTLEMKPAQAGAPGLPTIAATTSWRVSRP
jgi:hypothetical protein